MAKTIHWYEYRGTKKCKELFEKKQARASTNSNLSFIRYWHLRLNEALPAQLYSFWINNATLSPGNPLRFICNLLEKL